MAPLDVDWEEDELEHRDLGSPVVLRDLGSEDAVPDLSGTGGLINPMDSYLLKKRKEAWLPPIDNQQKVASDE